MADEKQFGIDDEYHFTEPETREVYGEMPSAKSNTKTSMKRYALIIIGVVILGFALYKVISVFFGHEATTTRIASTPVLPRPAPISQPSVDLTQTTQAIDQLNQQLQGLNQRSLSHQAELQDLKTNSATINTQLTTLSNKVDTINTALAKISEQVQALKPKPRRRIVRVRSKPIVSYYLQAAVPGRAWLQRSDGTTLTVSVGTYIPDYGTVNVIDPQNGLVITRSGKIIRYNSNER